VKVSKKSHTGLKAPQGDLAKQNVEASTSRFPLFHHRNVPTAWITAIGVLHLWIVICSSTN